MLKVSRIKKSYIYFFLLLILCATIIIGIFLKKPEESNDAISKDNTTIEENTDEDIILSINNSVDLAVDYFNIKNLISESELVAIVKVKSGEGMNYNPIKKEYVPVYTTGVLEIQNILSNTSDKKISEGQELEYVRLGGKIEYGKYLNGLREVEKEKLQQNMYDKTNKSTEELARKIVKDIYIDDIEIENDKEYLVFLKFTNDYNKYNIIGFEYGLREYDSNTMMVKNNSSNQFESMERITTDINKLAK